jgi:hypothetical protein
MNHSSPENEIPSEASDHEAWFQSCNRARHSRVRQPEGRTIALGRNMILHSAEVGFSVSFTRQ